MFMLYVNVGEILSLNNFTVGNIIIGIIAILNINPSLLGEVDTYCYFLI